MSGARNSDAPGPDWPGAQRAYRGRAVEEPSNAEVMRRLDDMAQAFKEDLAEIREAWKLYLPREVYEARHTALQTHWETRHATQETKIQELEHKQAASEDQRRADRKWVVTVIVVPVALFVAQLFLSMNIGAV